MRNRYYLSEMPISDKHGGGLTLIRVLGDELFQFTNVISPIQFPLKGFDHIRGLDSVEIRLWEEPGDFVKKEMPSRFSTDYFINQLKRLVGSPNTRYVNWDYYRVVYTKYLAKRIELEDSGFLVVPQNVHAVLVCNQLHRNFGIRYVTWMMDDHLMQLDAKTKEYRYPYPDNFEQAFKYHLKNACHVFVISSNMGEFYKRRFGVDSTVLFSPADPVEQPVLRKPGLTDTMRFCHFGRVWKWTEDAVERFALQLESLNATLDIYSHFPLEGALKFNPRVFVKEPVGGDEVIERMRDYDAVTIFSGFKDDVRHLTEFNISTKMSECLASGLPTLFIGPDYGAMAVWAKQHNCGLIISEPECKEQLRQINRLRETEFRNDLVTTSLLVAKKYTSVKEMKSVWRLGWEKLNKSA